MASQYTVLTLGLAAGSSASDLLLFGFGQGAVAPPVAGFTGTPTSGFSPLAVAFTDTSTGTITSEQFDPGDGSGVQSSVPASYTYTSAGTYSPSLTVIGPGGSDTLTRTDYITVTSPPPPPPTPTGFVCATAAVVPLVLADAFSIPLVEASAVTVEC